MENKENKDNRWKIRRNIVNLTLTFSALSITYLMLKGNDTQLHQAIANGLILLSGSVIGSYIFGATWDDKK
jgi:hypothetical protein|tara:strand:+ start:590 stop:802 length:213 start_codon:yes stop_codon:yes gene_type:complete